MHGTFPRLMPFVVLFVAGCKSSTAPASAVPLSLNIVATPATGHTTLESGSPAYQCDFSVVVTTAGGSSGDYSLWSGGSIDLKLTSTGYNYSSYALQSDYVHWFGTDSVGVGASVAGTVSYSWTGPFTGTLSTNYEVVSATAAAHLSTTTPLTCQ